MKLAYNYATCRLEIADLSGTLPCVIALHKTCIPATLKDSPLQHTSYRHSCVNAECTGRELPDKRHFQCPYFYSDLINSYVRIDKFSIVRSRSIDHSEDSYVLFSMHNAVLLSDVESVHWKALLITDLELGKSAYTSNLS